MTGIDKTNRIEMKMHEVTDNMEKALEKLDQYDKSLQTTEEILQGVLKKVEALQKKLDESQGL